VPRAVAEVIAQADLYGGNSKSQNPESK
jgi:hypothetical protein